MASAPVLINPSPIAQACACGLPLARRAKFCPECGEPRAVTGAKARPGSEEPATGKGGTAARDAGDADNEPAPDDGPSSRDEEDSPAARRVKNRSAQRVESQAAYRALKSDIVDARRKALSTLTGVTSTAVVGLVAYGLIGKSWSILALAAVPLLLTMCFLCWRRERVLTRIEYLSLPHSQGRNGRLRCINCGSLSARLPEDQASRIERYDCIKCHEKLFAT